MACLISGEARCAFLGQSRLCPYIDACQVKDKYEPWSHEEHEEKQENIAHFRGLKKIF